MIVSTIVGLIGTFLYDPKKKDKIPDMVLEASKVIGNDRIERTVKFAYDNFSTKEKRHDYVVSELKGFRDRSSNSLINSISDDTIVTLVTLAENAYADQMDKKRRE
jgi:hypothetical protein